MTHTIPTTRNKDFFTCPENFYYIGAFNGTNATCVHNEFTLESGTKNVRGQYRLTRTCKGCGAYRTYFLYAKKVGK